VEQILRATAEHSRIAGVGVTGFLDDERNVPVISRLLVAAGL
jgi:shikimate kinase